MKVAGFGFRKGAGVESLLAALEATGATGVTKIATAEGKADALAIRALAEQLHLPLEAVSDAALPAAEVLTQSEKSTAMYGTGSLSEAAALIAAGPGARLLGPRVISGDTMATCAIAEVVT